MNQQFVSFWVGQSMAPIQELSARSFASGGASVKVFTYKDFPFLKDLGIQEDANQVLPESEVFENPFQSGTYAAFANIFRYKLLQLGNFTWFDLDVVKLKWEERNEPYLFGRESEEFVNNAVLRAPKESELLDWLLREAMTADPTKLKWGQLGPKLLTRAIGELGLEAYVKPQREYYPIPVDRIWELFDPLLCDALAAELDSSSGLHLWNEVLRKTAPELASLHPPEGSLMSAFYEKNGVAQPTSYLDASWASKVLRPRIRRYLSWRGRLERKLRK